MAQLTGSGPGHGANYAMVDNSVNEIEDGRLYTTGSITDLPNVVLDSVKVRGSGLVVFTKDHDRQIMGHSYLTGSTFYDIPDGGIVSVMVVVGSCDLHNQVDMRSDGDANLIMYENTQVTNSGNQLYIMNQNRCCGSIMNTTIWEGPTIGASGDIIHTAMFLGGSGLGTKFASAAVGTGIHGEDLILCAGSTYLIKLENLAYRDISYDWNLVMHEHC